LATKTSLNFSKNQILHHIYRIYGVIAKIIYLTISRFNLTPIYLVSSGIWHKSQGFLRADKN